MFMRRTIEILTFVAYWFVAVPILYEYLVAEKLIIWDLNNLKDSIYSHAVAGFVAILIYMVAFRISVWVYIKCKKHDIKMYNSMKSLAMDVDELERQAKKLRDQQNAKAMGIEEEHVSKWRTMFKWLPKRAKTSDQPKTQSIIAAKAPGAQRKMLLDKGLRNQSPPAPPSTMVYPTASNSPLPRRPAPKLPIQSPALHRVPTVVTVDAKYDLSNLQERIAALHHTQAPAYSSPVLKKKAMTNPGFVSSSGDWV